MKSLIHVGKATLRREDNGDVEILTDGPFVMTRGEWHSVVAALYENVPSEDWMRNALGEPPLSNSEA